MTDSSQREHLAWREGDLQPIKRFDEPHFPVGGVLVLGSDWDGTDGYCIEKERLRNGASLNALGPTWKNLKKLFQELADSINCDGAIGAQIVVAPLRQALRKIKPYPNGCYECAKIPGGDFFPGGDGFPRC